jgi:hypothetical protein
MTTLKNLGALLERRRWEFYALIASSCVVSAIEGVCTSAGESNLRQCGHHSQREDV